MPRPAKFTITCSWCGTEKAVTRPYRKFCSNGCSLQASRAKLTALREAGCDPAQTDEVQDKRRAFAKARIASGELVGRALAKEYRRQDALRAAGALGILHSLDQQIELEGRPVRRPATKARPAYVSHSLRGKEYEQTESRWTPELIESDILIVSGHGASIRVERGELVVRSGASYSGTASTRTLIRGLHGVSSIVMLGSAGLVTLQAIQWCAAQKVALFSVTRDGVLSSIVSLPSVHNAVLHRMQHDANPLQVAKKLVQAKLEACIKMRPSTEVEIRKHIDRLGGARSMVELRVIEAHAALPYWRSWAFTLNTSGRSFPDHWRDFCQRGSPLSAQNRNAVHPINAMLNYGYAVLAGATQLALEARGFDVSLGTLHADVEGRPSLVYDVIEPLRPLMDYRLLGWAAKQKWRREDFVVDSQGVVSLHASLAKVVIEKSAVSTEEVSETLKMYLSLLSEAAQKQQNH